MSMVIKGMRFLTVQGAINIVEDAARTQIPSPVDGTIMVLSCSPDKRCKECLYCAWEVIDRWYQQETRRLLGTKLR